MKRKSLLRLRAEGGPIWEAAAGRVMPSVPRGGSQLVTAERGRSVEGELRPGGTWLYRRLRASSVPRLARPFADVVLAAPRAASRMASSASRR